MSQQFPTNAASATCEEWGWVVVFGSIEGMDGQPYLMLQLAHGFTADDVRLGQDRPYIEINNQGWSWYGHVNKFELHRDRVFVQMDREAQERMENDGAFTFNISLSDETFKEVKAAVADIFRGSDCYASHAASALRPLGAASQLER